MTTVGKKFEELVKIMARLRGPDGCPWDKEQTPQSAVGYIIEEACEAVEAIERDTPATVKEELGDLLFTLANLGRFLKVDPETALRKSLKKFTQRFQWMEDVCKQKNTPLQDLSDPEWDDLWNQAQIKAKQPQS